MSSKSRQIRKMEKKRHKQRIDRIADLLLKSCSKEQLTQEEQAEYLLLKQQEKVYQEQLSDWAFEGIERFAPTLLKVVAVGVVVLVGALITVLIRKCTGLL